MIPLEVATLIDEFNIGPITVTRRATPVRNAHGEYEPSLPTDVVLNSFACHTASGRELEKVPEADRHRETVFWAGRARLFTADDGFAADTFAYQGRSFRVVTCHDYALQGLCFHGLAVLEDARVADQVTP